MVGVLGIAPAANAASPAQSFLKRSESTPNNVFEIKHRGRNRWPRMPIAPSYIYFDYPYYYSRGYYPTHIGPGHIYYGYPYSDKRDRYRR